MWRYIIESDVQKSAAMILKNMKGRQISVVINWFLTLDTYSQVTVLVAIIGLIGSVAVAIINRVSSRKSEMDKNSDGKQQFIYQNIQGSNNTVVGIQINHKEETDK